MRTVVVTDPPRADAGDADALATVQATAGAVNVPVVLGGQAVYPGDVVVADDGVVVARAADRRQGP